jgi:hypothetical protein
MGAALAEGGGLVPHRGCSRGKDELLSHGSCSREIVRVCVVWGCPCRIWAGWRRMGVALVGRGGLVPHEAALAG